MKPERLTSKDKRKLRKKFPERKITKEEMQIKREKRTDIFMGITTFIALLFELTILAMALYTLYLMWTYRW